MATESFEKDFIVTDKQVPLWEQAFANLENLKVEWTPANNRKVPANEILDFLKKAKS